MPIYEYQCAVCGRVKEVWQRFSDPPLASCPECGGAMTKLISHCAFHLKGSGWYVTDYSGSRANSAKREAAQESKESAPGKTSDQGEGKSKKIK
uniref:Zinc ribbon domain-containing protein n=1 Tax=Desulfobacca acetoxidans TaxID=60893 RepID=A0A7C5ALS4_9BACT